MYIIPATSVSFVYILFLNPGGPEMLSFNRIGSFMGGFTASLQSDEYFGTSVAYLPDINGDGKDELCVGNMYNVCVCVCVCAYEREILSE